MSMTLEPRGAAGLPAWVPGAARLYLAHTELGVPIRKLAREQGCHASTVLRQVRKIEARRDDPLVDAALIRLGRTTAAPMTVTMNKEAPQMSADRKRVDPGTSEADFHVKACQVLGALARPGAMLAVAEGMEKAVIVTEEGGDAPSRGLVVEARFAQDLALREWIACDAPARVSRYRITSQGRAELRRQLARTENSATGFAEAQTGFDGPPLATGRRMPFAESPLHILARRRDKDGRRFLSAELVQAGERLREDFELSQIGARTTPDWDSFLVGPTKGQGRGSDPLASGGSVARERVAAALEELGPGLADVALRCCCYLEGLEKTEQRMGWSSRSGKIVLRIALQRLRRYYDAVLGPGGGLIG